MIPNLRSYFEIGTSGHELINFQWIRKLFCDVDCIMFSYFENLKTKEFQTGLVNHFTIQKMPFLHN